MSLTTTVGIVHPGTMGVTVGAALTEPTTVLWAGHHRSPQSLERANRAGFTDVGSLSDLAAQATTIISVCPPDQAITVARSIAQAGYAGTYVDANAISPATARNIDELFDDMVDGGIVGPPIQKAGTTRLYLSGSSARKVQRLFDGSNLEVRIVEGPPGAASAVKMCFAGWTKGTAALLLAINALAQAEGVSDDLWGEWATSMPELIERSQRSPGIVGPKAWRFEGEMREIADSFAAAGLPSGFHRAAAEIYGQIAELKSVEDPTLDDVLRRLS